MNRQERRKLERKAERGVKAIKALTPAQTEVIEMAVKARVNQRMGEFAAVIDRNMTAGLMERGWSISEIELLQDEMAEGVREDGEKINRIEKEKIDMAKVEKEVREVVTSLINKGVSKAEALKELQFKFPKLSKSMVAVAYGRVKEEISPKAPQITREKIVELAKKYGLDKVGKQKIAEELQATYSTIATYVSKWGITSNDLHEAEDDLEAEVASVIFGEAEKEDLVERPKENKPVQEVIVKEEPKKEEEKKMENNLEVIKLTVKGKNGTYEACGEGVRLNMDGDVMAFKTVAELEQFTEEFKQVFGMVK